MTDPIEALRTQLLDAALPHVPFDGWTWTALRRAARDVGLDTVAAQRAFPGGMPQVVEYYSARADRRMVAALEAVPLAQLRIRERIALAVRTRLAQAADERESARRALAYLALPGHAVLATRCLYRTVDAMWYAVGDTSTDFSFYTKRATLAGVYAATLVYWLNDRSADSADTWAFLDRRIDGVMQIPRRRAQLRGACTNLASPLRLLRRVAPFTRRPAA